MDIFILFCLLMVMGFVINWIKVSIFMWGANLKGSSFKMTFAYMIGKSELKG